jgi:integrase
MGLRSIEISRTNVGDIRELEGYSVMKIRGKGMKIMDAKLRPDLVDAINVHLRDRGSPAPDEPLIVSIGNLAKGRISPKTVQARVRHYFRLAGLQKEGLSCHSLRATCAVLTISIGKADLLQVQRLLRHSDPKVTMRYIQTLDWLKDNAVDRNPISL